jgi:hypothetical protein
LPFGVIAMWKGKEPDGDRLAGGVGGGLDRHHPDRADSDEGGDDEQCQPDDPANCVATDRHGVKFVWPLIVGMLHLGRPAFSGQLN